MTLLLLLAASGPPYEGVLLDAARRAIERGEAGDFEVAVVTAHMALEVMVEQVIGALLQSRGVPDLDEPLSDLLPSFNLGNEKLRKLYNVLSGDPIQDESFWQDFKTHAARRNKIVHNGLRVPREDAENSITTVETVLAHLQGVVQTKLA